MSALSTLAKILTSSTAESAFEAFPFSTTGATSFSLLETSSDASLSLSSGGGFNISGAAALCASAPTHSWEYGAATMALLELHTPWATVFGMKSGWNSAIDIETNPAAQAAFQWITLNDAGGVDSLCAGQGSTGDPASLGVIAWMIGKTTGLEAYTKGTQNTVDYLMTQAPRYDNGAISHRSDTAELWADFMYMTPPVLAFYGAETNDPSYVYEGYNQCKLYREVLQTEGTGAWSHIIGTQSYDPGKWSTGNGWAAAGMVRVLFTIRASGVRNWEGQDATWWDSADADLVSWIKEILDGVQASGLDTNGLVRNYLDDGNQFGEISGSALFASVVYRLAGELGDSYVQWADGIRETLNGKDSETGAWIVSADGAASPAIDPLAWGGGAVELSPEGQSFVVMMYSAWRDCVLAGTCVRSGSGVTKRETKSTRHWSVHRRH